MKARWEPSCTQSSLLPQLLPTASCGEQGGQRARAKFRQRGGCSLRVAHLPQSLVAHLQVKTSVRSLHVLHLTKQHQWNLQLHCQTLVYWWVL